MRAHLVCPKYRLLGDTAIFVNHQGPIRASFDQHAADALAQDVSGCFLCLLIRLCLLP